MTKPPKNSPRSLDVHKAIRQAAALLQRGKLKEAEKLFEAVLSVRRDHFDALHLLGILRGQQGRHDAAVELISLALAENPGSAEALSNLATALVKLDRDAEAVQTLNKFLAVKQGDADALRKRADLLVKLHRHDEAIASYDTLLERRPEAAVAWHRRGSALQALNQFEEAIASYDRALALNPDSVQVLFERGNALAGLQRHDKAIADLDATLARSPKHLGALNNKGTALLALRRYGDALGSFNRALEVNPEDFDLLVNRGTAVAGLGRYDEAVASYDKALLIRPDHVALLENRGRALLRSGRNREALDTYTRALIIDPHYVEALVGEGIALSALGSSEQAIARFDRALAIRPDVLALQGRADALGRLRRRAEAVASYEQAFALSPEHDYLLGALAFAKAGLCDWRDRAVVEQSLVEAVRAGRLASSPFPFLSMSDNPADQRACAALHVRDRFTMRKPSSASRVRRDHDRLRVAYLSGDFRDHAVAYLTAGLFERHDRERFEISAISFGAAESGEMQTRLRGAFENFVDVHTKSDAAIAALLEDMEIDIALDLMGFTRNSRPGILALRPAPIQANYLGYPGTMGADFIDYIIADEFVVPQGEQCHYSEKVVYLPDCFQANDSKREIGKRTPTRADAGLPESAFVFCCFNNSYKIKPDVFDIWMRLLQRVDASVLWLRAEHVAIADNLKREAAVRGVDPGRLVFAPRAKRIEEHLARHRQADLFLDTLPYNAHTTASDALWAELPLVTCGGTTFSGRVAASLLHAIGLPELITSSLEEYEALALRLATDEKLLSEIKGKLARNRLTKPLFDTDRFRRHIEAAYTTMWEIHQRGEEPRSFAVSAVD